MKRSFVLITVLVLAAALTACAAEVGLRGDGVTGTTGGAVGATVTGDGFRGNVSTTGDGRVNGTNNTLYTGSNAANNGTAGTTGSRATTNSTTGTAGSRTTNSGTTRTTGSRTTTNGTTGMTGSRTTNNGTIGTTVSRTTNVGTTGMTGSNAVGTGMQGQP